MRNRGNMNLVHIENYEVKTSRTDQKIPVVNGVHLHSIYNPFKEAEALIEKNLTSLETKKEVLVLGLGFAYHINELIETMSKIHGDNNFKIVVIEPNIQVYNDCIELDLLNKKNVIVYAGFTSAELYSDSDLVHFLLKKPTVIAHPPSFNLYQLYFKEVLSFVAPSKIGESIQFLNNAKVKDYLRNYNQEMTFKEICTTSIAEKHKFEDMDFLAMALNEMTKGSVNTNNNK